MRLYISPDICPQDHVCPLIKICPVQAISQPGVPGLPVINNEACIMCGQCVLACPKKAVTEIKD